MYFATQSFSLSVISRKYCPNISTTPITAMGCRQCSPLIVVQLKGKHYRKPHCCNGVVDTFEPTMLSRMRGKQMISTLGLCIGAGLDMITMTMILKISLYLPLPMKIQKLMTSLIDHLRQDSMSMKLT